MKITSGIMVTALAVVLSIGTTARAAIAEPQAMGQSMTFTGVVQGVDVGQGVVVVHGPKPGSQNANGQSSVIIQLTKVFKIDRTTVISVGGNAKSTLADIKNGDPIQVGYVQTNSGQFLAKSMTDSNRPPAKRPPPPSSYY